MGAPATASELADRLNAHWYDEDDDLAWLKIDDLQPLAESHYGKPLRPWVQSEPDADPHAVIEHYLTRELCCLPEDPSSYPNGTELTLGRPWQPLTMPPRVCMERILRFNYYWPGPGPRRSHRRKRPSRAPRPEEVEWYRFARDAFFTIVPPDDALFFEPVLPDGTPRCIPETMIGLTRRFIGLVFHWGEISERTYRMVTRVDG